MKERFSGTTQYFKFDVTASHEEFNLAKLKSFIREFYTEEGVLPLSILLKNHISKKCMKKLSKNHLFIWTKSSCLEAKMESSIKKIFR